MALITFICQPNLKIFLLYIYNESDHSFISFHEVSKNLFIYFKMQSPLVLFHLHAILCPTKENSWCMWEVHSIKQAQQILLPLEWKFGVNCSVSSRLSHAVCWKIGLLGDIIVVSCFANLCLSNKYPSIYIYGFSILLNWLTKWWAIHMDH